MLERFGYKELAYCEVGGAKVGSVSSSSLAGGAVGLRGMWFEAGLFLPRVFVVCFSFFVREVEVGGTNVCEAEMVGTEVGGAEVGGTEVGGAEVDGAEVGGAEVGGAEVGGAKVGGVEVGGSEVDGPEVRPVSSSSLVGSAVGLMDCLESPPLLPLVFEVCFCFLDSRL